MDTAIRINQNLNNKSIVTIQDLIGLKVSHSLVDYSNLSFKMTAQHCITIPFQNLVTSTFSKELNALAVDVSLTDEEYYKYRFKPKLLSFDIYGYTELFYIIDFLNGIYNIKDFDKKNLRLVPKDELYEFLSLVRQADLDNIEYYDKFVE